MTATSKFVESLIGKQEKVIEVKDPYLEKAKDIRFDVARVMLCGLLKNQFYRSKDDAKKEALELFKSQAKTNPEFLLKTAAFARSTNIKGMILLALAALSARASDEFLDNNREEIISVLSTFAPNQLLQFVELVKSKALGKGFGSRAQKWVAAAMENWDADKVETYTLQYASTIKALLRLVHPSYKDVRGNLVRYVLDPSKKTPNYGNAVGKRQKALEKIKKSHSDETVVANTMLKFNLPWDAIKGFYPGYNTGSVGLATLANMGLSALLLNLKNLDSVLTTENGLKALELKFEDTKNGRSIPLDFAKPYIHCTNVNVKELLTKAIANTLYSKIEAIEGRKVGLSIDVSGSMAGEALLTAGLLAVPFLQLNDLWFTTFSDDVHEEGEGNSRHYYYKDIVACPVIKNKKPHEQVKSLLSLETVGGTNLSAPIVKATNQNRKMDLMVLITDEYQNNGLALQQAWDNYKSKVNPRAELWIINASNTELGVAGVRSDPSVIVYQTMTPSIFNNLKFFGQDLISAIEGFDIRKKSKK